MAETTKVGFIGLGTIGRPMATSVVKKGFPLTVFDLNQAAMASLIELGPGGVLEGDAWAGTLSIMTDGDRADADEVMPILETMGDAFTYCGPLGTGHAMKLVNNYITAGIMSLHTEALTFGVKAGLKLKALDAACEQGYETKDYASVLLVREAEAGIKVRLADAGSDG